MAQGGKGNRVGYTVRRLSSGRWQTLVRDPVSRKQVSVGTFADKRMAERAGIDEVSKQHRGVWQHPGRGDVELRTYMDGWLDSRRRTGKHGDRYAIEAERMARVYIYPALGHLLLRELTPQIVRQWHNDVIELRRDVAGRTGLVPAKVYRLLHAVMAEAVHDELVVRNVVDIPGASKEDTPERPLVEPEQIAALADAIKPWWRAVVLVAGWCGLRFGELGRLRRRDVDLLHGTLRITEAKTTAGIRTVYIPTTLVPELEQHLATWSAPGLDGFVFVGPRGAPMFGPNFGRDFRAARAAVGLDHVTLHDLRHAAGTMAAQLGASEREVMARLGHASPDAARRYQHAAERRAKEIADRLAGLYEERGVNAHPTRIRSIGRLRTGSDQG